MGVVCRGDQHVIGLTRAEAEFVDFHGFDVLAVGLHHCQRQSRDTHVVKGVRAAIDETQAQALATLEEAGPVACRGSTVAQKGQRGGREIGEIGRIHAHLLPHAAFVQGCAQSVARDIVKKVEHGWLVEVVVVALHFEFGKQRHRVGVSPVGQQHDMVAIGLNPLAAGGLDDDGTIQTMLFLTPGVGVVPVGAGLQDLELIGERGACRDAVETDAWYAVHVKGQDDAVPVNGGSFLQTVDDADRHRVALAPVQRGGRDGAIDSGGGAEIASVVDGRIVDDQLEVRATEYWRRAGRGRNSHVAWRGECAACKSSGGKQHTAGRQPLHEAAA